MEDHEGRKYDTRQMDGWRRENCSKPGEVRVHHLDGPVEIYTLTAWHVRVGEKVEAPQIIATLETPSFTWDFEAFDSGMLTEQCFGVGEAIPDGAVVARIT